MWHRTVSDLMTTAVVKVRRDTGFKEIAKLLAEHDITAVPVVDGEEHAVGVVSEADLLRKEGAQLDPAGLLPVLCPGPADRAKAEATTAEGLMNSPAVTARPASTTPTGPSSPPPPSPKASDVVITMGCGDTCGAHRWVGTHSNRSSRARRTASLRRFTASFR